MVGPGNIPFWAFRVLQEAGKSEYRTASGVLCNLLNENYPELVKKHRDEQLNKG